MIYCICMFSIWYHIVGSYIGQFALRARALASWPKTTWRERVILQLVHHPGSQELKTGADAETTEQSCPLACSSWIPQPAFWQHPAPPAHRRHHSELGPSPHPQSRQMSYRLINEPINSMEAFSPIKIPSSQMTLICVKLTQKTSQQLGLSVEYLLRVFELSCGLLRLPFGTHSWLHGLLL